MHSARGVESVRNPGTPALTVFLAVMLVALGAPDALGQTKPRVDRAEPCCNIVSINGLASTATAKNTVTGQILTFAVPDKTMLQSLRVGQAIYFDSETQKVSLTYGEPCCEIIPPDGVRGAVTSAIPAQESRAGAGSTGTQTGLLQPTALEPCCEIVADAALNSHIGKVVANFPAGVDLGATTVDVLKAGTNEKVGGWFGSGNLAVAPGTYDVKIFNKVVSGVVVQGGHDTQVKVGAIRLKGGANSYADILDSDATTKITGGYGLSVGLPAGNYSVRTGAGTEQIAVQAGKVTEF